MLHLVRGKSESDIHNNQHRYARSILQTDADPHNAHLVSGYSRTTHSHVIRSDMPVLDYNLSFARIKQ